MALGSSLRHGPKWPLDCICPGGVDDHFDIAKCFCNGPGHCFDKMGSADIARISEKVRSIRAGKLHRFFQRLLSPTRHANGIRLDPKYLESLLRRTPVWLTAAGVPA